MADIAREGLGKGRLAYLDVKAQCNSCGDAGARALCNMLIELRESGIAAVRAIHLWKNELGDEGACAVADLVAASSVEGSERFWVAEVRNGARASVCGCPFMEGANPAQKLRRAQTDCARRRGLTPAPALASRWAPSDARTEMYISGRK